MVEVFGGVPAIRSVCPDSEGDGTGERSPRPTWKPGMAERSGLDLYLDCKRQCFLSSWRWGA